MKFDLSRHERQLKSVEKWRQNKGIGGIDASPRFGKTNIGIISIDKLIQKDPDANILVLCPSDIIRKTWDSYNTDNKYQVETKFKFKSNIEKYYNNQYTLIIVDEVHKFNSPDDITVLKAVSSIAKYRMALSGSYPYNNRIIIELFPVIDKISEQEAVDKGWIAPFVEYNVAVELDETQQERYARYSRVITETMELFKNKHLYLDSKGEYVRDTLDYIFKLHSGLKVQGKYIPGSKLREHLAEKVGWHTDLDLNDEYNRQLEEYWNPNNIYERVKRFKNVVKYRNELLNNNQAKLDAILRIIKTNDVPTIIFNDSIDFVNIVADALGDKAIPYHSKIKSRPMIDKNTGEYMKYQTGTIIKFGAKRLKDMAIDGIKSGEYKYLVTVKSLDESLDLPELEQAILTSGSINPLQQTQRSARAKTFNHENTAKLSRIYNIYVDDFTDEYGISHTSRDKTKLHIRQSKYKHEVTHISLDDLG